MVDWWRLILKIFHVVDDLIQDDSRDRKYVEEKKN